MDLLVFFNYIVDLLSNFFNNIFMNDVLTFDGIPISLGSIFIGITVIGIIIRLIFGAYSSNVNSGSISHSISKKGD